MSTASSDLGTGSIFAVAVWHGLYDFFVAAKPSEGTIAAVMSMAIVVWALVVLAVAAPPALSRSGKVTATSPMATPA